MLVIEANCDDMKPPGHCKNVWSRMSTVEVTEVLDNGESKEDMDASGT